MTLLTTPAPAALSPGLSALLAEASFVDERLAGDWVTAAPAPTPAGLRLRDRWAERAGGLDALCAQFATDPDSLAAACSGATLRRPPPAAWAGVLAGHLTAPVPAGRDDPWDRHPATERGPIPYAWLLGPLAERGLAVLTARLPTDLRGELLAAHLRRTAFWLAPALHRDFAHYRDRHRYRLDTALAARSARPPRALYRAYRAQAGPRGQAVWARRPVLARLAAGLAADEAALVGAVLDDLAADAPALAALLDVPRLAELTALTTGLGDRHEGGRSVCRLRFADGRELIYRPRRHDGLDLLRRALAGLPTAPPVPAQLTRSDHTWVGFVAAGAPADLDAYHAAAGALLAALHDTGGTDIHRDNLVRTALGPVVVDAETLHHPVTGFETAYADQVADRPLPPGDLVHSVLRLGLLPNWDCTADGAVLDGAHLLPDTAAATRIRLPAIVHPGTDAESVQRRTVPLPERPDLPAPDYDPSPYADTVAAAYAEALGRSRHGPGDGDRMRLLLRYTRRYVDVLLGVLEAESLRGGPDLDVALAALPDGGSDITTRLRAAELADLRRLDVPLFEYLPATGAVLHRGRRVGTARPTLASPRRPATQQALIRGALRARDGRPELTSDPTRPVAERAQALAAHLLTDLAGRAVPVTDGVSWFGSAYQHGRFPRLPVGWSLYDGQAGVALALAVGARYLGVAHDVTIAAVTPLLRRLLADPTGLCRRLGPGYLHGAAGVLWAVRRLPDLLDGWADGSARAARDADGALGRALAEYVLHDAAATGDLADGCAGALAVLAEPDASASDPVARAAVRRAAAGLAASTATADGLAHGRSGAALALWRAAVAIGGVGRDAPAGGGRDAPAGCDAAPLGAAAQRLLATDRAAGWTWCRGRSGVALAAAAIGVDTGLADMPLPAPPPTAAHHLCCGLVGHAYARVATAAEPAHLPIVAGLLDRLAADRTPRYLRPLPEGLHQPGLFQGAAGLALGLLALTRPGLPDPLRVTGGL
jgi:hypothetical protein